MSKTINREMNKFTNKNINDIVCIKYNHHVNVLQYICLRQHAIPNYLELFDYLVNSGIDINFCNADGKTVMDYALFFNDLNLVYMILQSDSFKKTSEDLSRHIVNHSRGNPEAILMLYEAGGDIVPSILNIVSSVMYMSDNILNRYMDIFLNKIKIPLNNNIIMNSLLLELAKNKNKSILLKLLTENQNLNVHAISPCYSRTLLHEICCSHNPNIPNSSNICIEIAKILINRGLNVNVVDVYGYNAIIYSAHDFKLFELLLQSGSLFAPSLNLMLIILHNIDLNYMEALFKICGPHIMNELSVLPQFAQSCISYTKDKIKNRKIINMLVSAGVDPHIKDSTGMDTNYYMKILYGETPF